MTKFILIIAISMLTAPVEARAKSKGRVKSRAASRVQTPAPRYSPYCEPTLAMFGAAPQCPKLY